MNDLPEGTRAESMRVGMVHPRRLSGTGALGWGVAGAVVLLVAAGLIESAARSLPGMSAGPLMLVPPTLGALVAIALYRLGVRSIERRAPSELALAGMVPDLAAGLLFGSIFFTAVMGVLLAIGAYTLSGPTVAAAWRPLAISISSGVVEELVFRGVVFGLLWSALGMWWALAVSSVLFGVAHLFNPHADIMAALGVTVGAGLPLAALFIVTGRLWASIGAHFAWKLHQQLCFRRTGLRL